MNYTVMNLPSLEWIWKCSSVEMTKLVQTNYQLNPRRQRIYFHFLTQRSVIILVSMLTGCLIGQVIRNFSIHKECVNYERRMEQIKILFLPVLREIAIWLKTAKWNLPSHVVYMMHLDQKRKAMWAACKGEECTWAFSDYKWNPSSGPWLAQWS